MSLTKCCLCIPLRAGTFLIALWFFLLSAFEAVTGFIGHNAILSYVSQTNAGVFWFEVVLLILIAVGGLFGLIGSCFASRRFIQAFSIISWINCLISAAQHVSSLVIVGINRQRLIAECAATGHLDISPTDSTPLYIPIYRNGTLNPDVGSVVIGSNASQNYAACSKEVEIFLIVAAVVVLVMLFLQFYFATVVAAYSGKLKSQPRHGKLRMQQEWDEQQMPMRESVY